MKLVCDCCGDIDHALVDGYGFGDRLLEGVMFNIMVIGDKIIAMAATKEDAVYIDDLNKEKWLAEAAVYAFTTNFLTCPDCQDDCVRII